MLDCVLSTGGAGFIGSALSTKICEMGLTVVAADIMLGQVHHSGARPAWLDKRVILEKGDIADAAFWHSLLARWRPRQIIHMAAETGTAQSLTEASRHAATNVLGTARMLDAVRLVGCFPERIILTSSRAVYGEGAWRSASGELFYPPLRSHYALSCGQWEPRGRDGLPATAAPHDAGTVAPNPVSIYGATKLAQEHILQGWCAAYTIPLSILSLQNVYGEGQSPHNPYTGIINIFHRIARSGQSIPLYEDGNITRDFIHIEDVARVLSRLLQEPGRDNHKFDVGSGVATTIHEAARIIARLHNAPPPVVCGAFRDGDVRSAVAATNAMYEVTGVRATVSFEEGAERVGRYLQASGFI